MSKAYVFVLVPVILILTVMAVKNRTTLFSPSQISTTTTTQSSPQTEVEVSEQSQVDWKTTSFLRWD